VEDVGYLIAFLASDKAGYINGLELSIAGRARLGNIALGNQKNVKDRIAQ